VEVALAGSDGLELDGAERIVPPRLLSAGVLDLESRGNAQPEVLRFSSPAMRAHTLFNLGVRPELALPVAALSDATGFVRAAVKRMRSSELAGSLSKTVAKENAGDSRSCCWRGSTKCPSSKWVVGSCGLNRTITLVCSCVRVKSSLIIAHSQSARAALAVAILPEGVFMSPDYGLVDEVNMQRRGYIDFFISGSHRIGIELTRDGNDLKVHTARFDVKSDSYAPLNLKTWVVVDFRQTKPRTKRAVLAPCLWSSTLNSSMLRSCSRAARMRPLF